MSEFMEYSKGVITDFLQTIVIVDDEAFLDEKCQTTPNTELPATIGRGITGTKTEQIIIEEDDDLHQLNAKKLSDKFAEQGLLCTTLRPTNNEIDTYEKVLKKADIVILDWKLKSKESDGETAKKLIKSIIQDANGNAQKSLRNIVIYSGESNLQEKIESIKNDLDSELEAPKKPDNYSLIYDNLQIKIYAKKATQRAPQDTSILKNEEELVESIIEDFTKQVAGLVPNMALQSLAELRKNTHKILGIFSKELDEAYLSHRMLLPHPKDAENFMIDLFIAEIQSILEDSSKSTDTLTLNQIVSWVEKNFDDDRFIRFFINGACDFQNDAIQEKLKRKYPSLQTADFKISDQINEKLLEDKSILLNVMKKIFEKGFEKSKCILLKEKDTNRKAIEPRCFTKNLYYTDEIAAQICNDFAILSTIKKRYNSPIPSMTLGTIVKDEKNKYFICIMPRCDAARIGTGNTSFPCLPLSQDNDNFELIIKEREAYVTLKIDFKSKKLTIIELNKEEGNNTQPLYAILEDDKLIFKDRENKKYYWLANLKRDKAQAILNKFAAQLSRVGFNESEYLRRSYQ